MKVEEIEVIITPDGKVRVSTSGFSGNECLESTAELESLLGGQILQRDLTAEAYATDTIKTTETIRVRGMR